MTNNYLITGDAFMRKPEVDAVIAKLQAAAGATCELQAFDLTDTPFTQILSAARTLPFLAESQILRIKQSDRLKEDAIDELEAYLKSAFAKTFLIFEAEKVDERSRFFKLIQQYGTVIRPAAADRMKREVQLIRAKLGEFKMTITPGAQKHLLDMCGESPIFLATMLDRLIMFAGTKTTVDETMTSQFEEDWSEAKIFDLSDAILASDTTRALKVLDKLVEIEGDVYAMLGFIHSQVKKLWQAKVLALEGSAPSQIAARLGMRSAYASANFFRGLEKFSLQKLERAIQELHDLDCKSKSGRADIKSAIQIWMVKLTAPDVSFARKAGAGK